MTEIRALEPNGLTAASTFSGCGGSSLGYRMAGFRVGYANEFVEAARETYLANAEPYTVVDGRDIRAVSGAEILEACGGSVDLLDGSPPCSDFSTAGKRDAGWGKVKQYSDTEQRVDDLFFEFTRLIGEVQPRTFVAENVSGLVKGTAKGYFKLILSAMKDQGYRVQAKLLNASWLGVPQARQRIIFVGVRKDQGFDPVFPKPLPYQYSVREAICPDEPMLAVYDTRGSFPSKDVTDTPASTITTQTTHHYQMFGGVPVEKDPETGQNLVMARYNIRETLNRLNQPIEIDPETGQNIMIDRYSIGSSWKKLKYGETPAAKHFNLTRVDPEKPCPTVTAAGGNVGVAAVAHWETPRKFTLGEVRRLCSFPDDFVLTGNYPQRWERLGRAVPPVMMSHIAAGLRDSLRAVVPVA